VRASRAPASLPHLVEFEYVWVAWLLSLAASFALFEGYAIRTHRATLSQFVWEMSRAWPPFAWLAGIAVGGLIVHFSGWGYRPDEELLDGLDS
jgi:hypothetical protein